MGSNNNGVRRGGATTLVALGFDGVTPEMKGFVKPGFVSRRGCPDCGGQVAYTEGCVKCLGCGWSECGG